MLKRTLAAFAVALTLVSGPAQAEPTPIPPPRNVAPAQATDDVNSAFIAWTQNVMAVLERANRASTPFLQMNFDSNDPESARATLRNLSQQAAGARAELAVARSQLDAMTPFAHPNATPEALRMSEILLRDSRASVANLDQLLNDMIAFVSAIERGDQAEINRLMPQIDRGATALMRAQATTLRARQQLLAPTSSAYHTVAGMASMYDGMASVGGANPDLAGLESAAEALRGSIIAERAALFLERSSTRHPNTAVLAELMQTREQFITANERARAILLAAAQEVRAGTYSEQSGLEFLRSLGMLELEYQRISRRQMELHAILAQ